MPQSQLARKDRFTISPAVRSRQLDDELILLDFRLGEYFSLNATGAAVWHGIERGLDLGQIDSEVAAKWPVPPDERWTYLMTVIQDLLDRGLVQPA